MDLRVLTSLKLYSMLMILMSSLIPINQAFSNEMSSDFKFCLIYYSNPDMLVPVPLQKENLKELSSYKVMVGNKVIMGKLGELLSV